MSIELTREEVTQAVKVYADCFEKGTITKEQMIDQIAQFFWDEFEQERRELNLVMQLMKTACNLGKSLDTGMAEGLQEVHDCVEDLCKQRGVSR